MSYKIQVFCEQPQGVTLDEVRDFIVEGAYFDDLKIEFSVNANKIKQSEHETLAVIYEGDKPPVVIHRVLEPKRITEETKELLFVLDLPKKKPVKQAISEKLLKTSQVFILNFDRELISDDCWEMLDSVESFLANRCDGIVYSPDDGFFDKDLEHFYSL